jgi:hypothetical protein
MAEEKRAKYKQNMPVIVEDLFGLQSSTDFSKMTEKMYSPDSIDMTTDLSGRAICKLNILYTFAKEYDVPMLEYMCSKFILLRVSHERKGRTEAVNMATAILGLKRLEGIEKAIEGGMGKK